MSTIQDQLKLERAGINAGAERYRAAQAKYHEKGLGSQACATARLTKEFILPVAESLHARVNRKGPGRRSAAMKLMHGADCFVIATIGLRTVFDQLDTNPNATSVCVNIGTRIEDELHFKRFEAEHQEYYQRVIEKFQADNTQQYRHKHRVLTHLAKTQGVEWNSWALTEKVHVGSTILDTILRETDLFEKKNYRRNASVTSTVTEIKLTDAAMEKIMELDEFNSMLQPMKKPLIVPPAEWENIYEGGYYLPELRKRTPLIKYKNAAQNLAVRLHDNSMLLRVVNKLQKTPWVINTQVHDVMKDIWEKGHDIAMPKSDPIELPACPFVRGEWDLQCASEDELHVFNRWKRDITLAHTAERERRGKALQFARCMSMAQEYREYEQFYFVYQADFRSRLYCASSGLNPQSQDASKGLLLFKNRKPLGARGGFWLCVHGSNVYGYDKDSYQGRYDFIMEQRESILAVSRDPIGQSSTWANADKPWQFLAFCFEFAAWAATEYSDSYESSIAVALDGTCNGLQHYSGMLRDSSGASATNLSWHKKPADIYRVVSDLCRRKLRDGEFGDDSGYAADWLSFEFDRKCTKRPVMTLPYGATRMSCREYIEDYIYERKDDAEQYWPEPMDKFRASVFFHRIVWEAMEETLVAAMQAMDWLQQASRQRSRKQLPVVWTAPNGFLIHQQIMRTDQIRVETQLMGRVALTLSQDNDRINPGKQALSVAPNFVHSHDASHMYLTVDTGGIDDYWLVHDSYGAHACHGDALQAAIRQSFVAMYEDSCPLQKFAEENDIDTDVLPIPPRGDFNLRDVLDAPYFFG